MNPGGRKLPCGIGTLWHPLNLLRTNGSVCREESSGHRECRPHRNGPGQGSGQTGDNGWWPRSRTSGESTGAAVNFICDVLDRARLAACVNEFAPDAIVHLAARTDFDGKNLSGYAANIEGVSNLVEAIRATPSVTRCIWTSTQLVCRVGYVPASSTDYQPDTVYGQSKVRTEEIVRASDGAGREWCLVRPTTVWGPGVNLHYQRFLKLVKLGLYFHVDSGPLYKSYGYIGNITHQYVRLLHAPAAIIQGRTLYLADYLPIDLVSWCNAFQRCLRRPSDSGDAENSGSPACVDWRRARTVRDPSGAIQLFSLEEHADSIPV